MGFKETIAADVDVFLNTEEFAEEMLVSVAGEEPVPVSAVLDEDASETSSLSFPDGTLVYRSKFFVLASALPSRPKSGKDIRINGTAYQVLDTADEAGVLVLTLERVSS